MFFLKVLRYAALITLIGLSGIGQTATVTSSMPVTATIPTTCTLATTSSLAFGTLASSLAVAQTDATGALSATCSNGGTYTVTSDYGLSGAGGTQRYMQSAGSSMYYNIYSNSGRSTLFPVTTGSAVTQTGNGAAQTITIYGRIPSQSVGSVGNFSDTLNLTVTF